MWTMSRYPPVNACITSRPTHTLPRCGTDFLIWLRLTAAPALQRLGRAIANKSSAATACWTAACEQRVCLTFNLRGKSINTIVPDPTIDSTTIVSNQKSPLINNLDEMQVIIPPNPNQDNIADT
jgi:hypothetical protein